MNNYLFLFISGIIFSLINLSYAKIIDLGEDSSEFILETKQIIIPKFPGAFNACITRWHNSLLMCFRIRSEKMISAFEIGFVQLDKDFNIISEPTILNIRGASSSSFSKNQDPRILTINHTRARIYH